MLHITGGSKGPDSFVVICKIFKTYLSENSRKSYIVDLANDVFGNFPPKALMNTFSSYEAAVPGIRYLCNGIS